ncbi:MAG: thioredoxin domain-containing protein [Ignavibacteriales bacterium]|nr:thioredoxin domain-containing protein [Ignavibacteriales bacterium]
MNRLQYETSPYLLQHKDNPVDWYPWGEEAFQKAVLEDKPILLSIGYSACHWCHVMAHESFENQKIAGLMNENFINIKVDREERPDVDNIYMNFVQLSTGGGGWPLTVFLTPALIPFFGGTYFPPDNKFGRPGFPKVLESIIYSYRNKKDEILLQKEEILSALNSSSNITKSYSEFTKLEFDKSFANLLNNYDEEFGGFGSAPKFPHSMSLMFLLNYYVKTGNQSALEIVENSLEKMARGGMYDQLGGGFHRYSTVKNWLIPHFEKMLYDNALLSRLYLDAFRLTKNKFHLQIAEDVLEYILREMTDPSGRFYSAQDADSEGEEGKYFIWEFDELKKLLDEQEFSLVVKYFGISTEGNFDGMNILTLNNMIDELPVELNLEENVLVEKITSIRKKIFAEREKRVKPGLDDKILTSWNALMIPPFCIAYGATGKDIYKQAAERNAEAIWSTCFKEEIIYHSFKIGKTKQEGFLDDYSFTVEAFISLYSITFNELWLERANKILQLSIKYFYDDVNYDFYFTSFHSKNLIVRTKENYDNATPSGASSLVNSLLQMAIYMNNPVYSEIAHKYISKFHDVIIKHPLSFSYVLNAAYFDFNKPKEIALICQNHLSQKKFIQDFYNEYYPFAIISSKIDSAESALELLNGKELIEGKDAIYVCENFTCKEPISTFDEMKKLMK